MYVIPGDKSNCREKSRDELLRIIEILGAEMDRFWSLPGDPCRVALGLHRSGLLK